MYSLLFHFTFVIGSGYTRIDFEYFYSYFRLPLHIETHMTFTFNPIFPQDLQEDWTLSWKNPPTSRTLCFKWTDISNEKKQVLKSSMRCLLLDNSRYLQIFRLEISNRLVEIWIFMPPFSECYLVHITVQLKDFHIFPQYSLSINILLPRSFS